jgi:adenylate kinase family enzyme
LNVRKNLTSNRKVAVIGNSGSGKTWFGRQLSELFNISVCNLDRLYFLEGGFTRKREKYEVQNMLVKIYAQTEWIIEGTYGEMVEVCLRDASPHLVWLNIELSECLANLECRGPSFEEVIDQSREEIVAGFNELKQWAVDYYTREDQCSHYFHEALFRRYGGAKTMVSTRSAMSQALKDIELGQYGYED